MPRQNYDKRTLRKMFAASYCIGIENYLAEGHQAMKELTPANQSASIQVLVRKRPLFDHEASVGEFDVVRATACGALVLGCCMRPDLKRPYISSYLAPLPCIGEGALTEEVCSQLRADEMVRTCLEGGSAAVCMFGQTGSGKTHTMQGVLQEVVVLLFGATRGGHEPPAPGHGGGGGLLPPGWSAALSCYEVCGQSCHDLLNGRERAHVRQDGHGNIQTSASRVELRGPSDFFSHIGAAVAARRSAKTARNDSSSRSHAFYHLTLHPPPGEASGAGGSDEAAGASGAGAAPRCGSLMLVDLAGAERAADSAAHDAERVAQCAEINSGLSVLKECFRMRIAAMQQQQQEEGNEEEGEERAPGVRRAPAVHVPYRQSLLTKLLRDPLEADWSRGARVALVATVSPCASDTEATLNTLRHACVMAGMDLTRDGDMRINEVDIPVVAAPIPIETLIESSRSPGPGHSPAHRRHHGHSDLRSALDAIVAAARRDGAAAKFVAPSAAASAAGLAGGEPLKWTAGDVAAWMTKAGKGAYAEAAKKLPAGVDGKALSRMPALRFKQMCGGDEEKGRALYELFREEVRSASRQRIKAAQEAADLLGISRKINR